MFNLNCNESLPTSCVANEWRFYVEGWNGFRKDRNFTIRCGKLSWTLNTSHAAILKSKVLYNAHLSILAFPRNQTNTTTPVSVEITITAAKYNPSSEKTSTDESIIDKNKKSSCTIEINFLNI